MYIGTVLGERKKVSILVRCPYFIVLGESILVGCPLHFRDVLREGFLREGFY